MQIDGAIGSTEWPTADLRFVRGRLQQLWVSDVSGYEWREVSSDVPPAPAFTLPAGVQMVGLAYFDLDGDELRADVMLGDVYVEIDLGPDSCFYLTPTQARLWAQVLTAMADRAEKGAEG